MPLAVIIAMLTRCNAVISNASVQADTSSTNALRDEVAFSAALTAAPVAALVPLYSIYATRATGHCIMPIHSVALTSEGFGSV